MTSNRRASGGACTLPDRCLSSIGRMMLAAAAAWACESHRTKIPYSPSLSSPKTVTPPQPGRDVIWGARSSAIAWATPRRPVPKENLTSLAYIVTPPLRGSCETVSCGRPARGPPSLSRVRHDLPTVEPQPARQRSRDPDHDTAERPGHAVL